MNVVVPAETIAFETPALDHLLALTDDTGTIQHATHDVPNRSTGYCTDDVARTLIVAMRAGRVSAALRPQALELARTSLAFLAHAQLPGGAFHNFMSYERTWLDDGGGDDANGRAMWALGLAMRYAPSLGFRRYAAELLERALPIVGTFRHLRGHAFAGLGLVEARRAALDDPKHAPLRGVIEAALRRIGVALRHAYEANARELWHWYEPVMTYDGARLCEASLRVGDALADTQLMRDGAAGLDFFERVTVCDGIFAPVGNDGWFPHGGTCAAFGQQPLEAAGLVDAAFAALDVLHNHPGEIPVPASHYEDLARLGIAWFHGANVLGRSLVTPSGACADGIEESGVSENAGAESTLAYLMTAYAVAEHLPGR